MSAVIETLTTWPVKGMAAESDRPYIEIDSDGLVHDRTFMLVEGAEHTTPKGKVLPRGRFLAMGIDPILVQFTPTLTEDGLTISHPRATEDLLVSQAADTDEHRIPVNIWGWKGEMVDQGDEAAAWHSDLIGRSVRLVAASKEKPRHPEGNPALGVIGCADSYPLTIVTTQSVGLVNAELEKEGHDPISVLRPRSNIVLSGTELPHKVGIPEYAFPEDFIDEIHVAQSGLLVILKRIKACGRCPVPDTNEITGEVKGAPVRKALGALARRGFHTNLAYGDEPELFWSQNFVVQMSGDAPTDEVFRINKGASVEVLYSDTTNWQSKRPHIYPIR